MKKSKQWTLWARVVDSAGPQKWVLHETTTKAEAFRLEEMINRQVTTAETIVLPPTETPNTQIKLEHGQ